MHSLSTVAAFPLLLLDRAALTHAEMFLGRKRSETVLRDAESGITITKEAIEASKSLNAGHTWFQVEGASNLPCACVRRCVAHEDRSLLPGGVHTSTSLASRGYSCTKHTGGFPNGADGGCGPPQVLLDNHGCCGRCVMPSANARIHSSRDAQRFSLRWLSRGL